MSTTPKNREIQLGLRNRRIARRINLGAMLAAGALFAAAMFGVWESGFSWLWFSFFGGAMIFHLAAGIYMGMAKCPRCRQRFSRRTLLGFISSLEDQLTTKCQNCSLTLE